MAKPFPKDGSNILLLFEKEHVHPVVAYWGFSRDPNPDSDDEEGWHISWDNALLVAWEPVAWCRIPKSGTPI